MKLGKAFAFLGLAVSASATTLVFDLSGSNHNCGTVCSFTSAPAGKTLAATGYASDGITTVIYLKGNGGDENGAGLSSFTDHEISGAGFIQFSLAPVSGYLIDIKFGSTTDGEGWEVDGSNVSGSLASAVPLLSGHDEGAHVIPGASDWKYLDIAATHWNVLVSVLTATQPVPEPTSWMLTALGALMVGLALYFRRAL